MRGAVIVSTVLLAVAVTAMAQSLPAGGRADVGQVLMTMRGVEATEPANVQQDKAGNLRFLGAPRGAVFTSPAGAAKSLPTPQSIAQGFIMDHATAFGLDSPRTALTVEDTRSAGTITTVRLGQTYAGIPVHGASAKVNLDADGAVVSLSSVLACGTSKLDTSGFSTTPVLSAATAKKRAIELMTGLYRNAGALEATTPELVIYDPTLQDRTGTIRLAWSLIVQGATDSSPVQERVLLDARTGENMVHYSLRYEARNRKIYDAGNEDMIPGTLVRIENSPNSGLQDADEAYDYYGDTYDFYFENHNRDSIDNFGLAMSATVRYCPWYSSCPYQNAFWRSGFKNANGSLEESSYYNRMFFGEGFTADDVIAHELTHGVTYTTSDLEYYRESGAINESLSDIWGEAVDLVNGSGNDSSGVRWLMGEDIAGGAIRDMADPPSMENWFYDTGYIPMPDTYLGRGWYRGSEDNGGVHHNSGVGNKLFYLMADGDIHNGYAVPGMGLIKSAQVFYTVQTQFLTMSSKYRDLGNALVQAASQDATLSEEEIVNVVLAASAVHVYTPIVSAPVEDLRALPRTGSNVIVLTWKTPGIGGGAGPVKILRKMGSFAESEADPFATVLYEGTGQRFLDTTASEGSEYYYTAMSRSSLLGYTEIVYARARSGAATSNHLSEPFSSTSPPDLDDTQIMFSPTADMLLAQASGNAEGYVNHSTYSVSVTALPGGNLPVAPEQCSPLNVPDFGMVQIELPQPVPFFGKFHKNWVISAAGYLAPEEGIAQKNVGQFDALNAVPTYSNYFDLPRIALLWGWLSPDSGGQVLWKLMDDRLVVVFNQVPELGASLGSTIELELFFSGHIRMSYKDLALTEGICGLSDGRGVPKDPVSQLRLVSDFTSMPAPSALSIDPIPMQTAVEGERIEFVVTAHGIGGAPEITMTSLPPGSAYTPMGNGQARFVWQTTASSGGAYTMQVKAKLGTATTTQDVYFNVDDLQRPPVVETVQITPAHPIDDDRLRVSFDISYPDGSLNVDQTTIYWVRNNSLIPALTNRRDVSPDATRPGDRWYCIVKPTAVSNPSGEAVTSSTVTIGAGTKGSDVNRDGAINVQDVQLIINAVLGLSTEKSAEMVDINNDNRIDVRDAQIVINALLNLKKRYIR